MSFVSELSAGWDRCWPGVIPLPGELRGHPELRERWVRFHNLPEGKRYADTAAEAAVVRDRQQQALRDLGLGARCVVVSAWFAPEDLGGCSVEHAAARHVGSRPWRVVEGDQAPPISLYASESRYPSAELDVLLDHVVNETATGVMILPLDLSWIYAPYDGGADIIAASPEDRQRLAALHPGWLSEHPQGL